MGVTIQIIGALIICFSSINLGIFTAWPSTTILLFKSENTTLNRPMEDIEISLFVSLPIFATLVTMPFFGGGLIDRMGRKFTLILVSLFLVFAWSMIALNNRVEIILIASVVAGFASSISLTSFIYIGEIAQNSIRGALTAGPNFFCCVGFLVSYCLGGFLEYHVMVYTCLTLAVAGVVMLAVLKDSPVGLLMKGKETEAARSVAFYRSVHTASEEVLTELYSIRLTLHSDVEGASVMLINEESDEKPAKTNVSCWQIFKTSQVVRRQFYLGLVLTTSYVCNGLLIVQIYAEPIFATSGDDSMSPNFCSIILGLMVVVTGLLAPYLVEKTGRRPLQVHTPVVSGISCLLLGIQTATEWFPKWTVLLFICVFAVSFTLGSGTVPFVTISEIFLPEIKSVCMTMLISWLVTLQFITFFLFNLLVPIIGLSPMFFFFALSCFSASIYFFYYLPETKGLSLYTIQSLFNDKVQTSFIKK